MPEGIILKGIGGFYYVKTESGTYECRARGKLRKEKITPLVGDKVIIKEQNGSYVIDSILPRKTELIRPPVANVDHCVIVFAASMPDMNPDLLDKFLLLSEHKGLKVTICINKIDLKDINDVEKIIIPYKSAGYKVIYTSVLKGYGIDELKSILRGRITVFAGPSGVGKSTIINSLSPSFNVKTGDVSSKIGRGKHTTRHSELLQLEGGGFVVDTPGFSSLDISFIDKDELDDLFPEFRNCPGSCRFPGCSHISEPGCSIKEALSKGQVNESRYGSYVKIYNEISKMRRNY